VLGSVAINWKAQMRNLGIRGLLSALLLALALLIFNSVKGTATATTLYVDNNDATCSDDGSGTVSQPFCTIGQAASVAVAGQTVQVASGTYAEDVTPAHSGMAGSRIIFTAAPRAHVIVTGKATGSNGFSLSGKRYITIKGFTISGTVRYGISAISGCSFLRIIGNHITRAGLSTSSSTVKSAINLAATTHSLIQNNVLDHNSSSGVYLAARSHDNTVDHNIISFNASGYTDSSGAYHRLAPGINVLGTDNIVSNNISHDNDDSGIQLVQGARGNVVVNNVVYHNKNYPNRQAGDHGIDVSSAPDNTVVSNTVYDNVTAGINVEGTSIGTTLANNISANNGLSASPRTKGNIRVTSSAIPGTTIDYDQIYLTYTTGTVITWDSITFSSLVALHAHYPDIEDHGLQAKPDWVNPRSGDFHLMENSPAIDSANSSAPGQLPYDQEGTPRRNDPDVRNTGAGIRGYDDRGAYEFWPRGRGSCCGRWQTGPA
jgi:parallel beta-helix repeat protein